MALSRHGHWKKDLFFIGFNAVTCFSTYILGHKVDPIRHVTWSRRHVLGHKVDLVKNVTTSRSRLLGHKFELTRNVTTSRSGFWPIGIIYSGRSEGVEAKRKGRRKAREK